MYYTDRDYLLTDNDYIFYKTARIRPNNIFRSFLIKENADNTTKYFHNKKKEILPEYSNIKKKFNHHIQEIKDYFNIDNTIFKEIKTNDIIAYSKFKKDLKSYLFGPKGMITQKNDHLKKYYDLKGFNKIINTKIYAGRWEYFEDNTKSNRYLQRLKYNHKKLLDIGGHFSTEDDIGHKIHELYLRKKKKDETVKKNLEKNNTENNKKIENKRRHSIINDINHLKIFNKNIFEFTAIDYNSKRNSNFQKKYNNSITDQNKTMNNTLSEIKHKKLILKKVKNIFKKEKLEKEINKESKRHFKK